jgi:membrane fusion protein, multidrug efflux system
MRDKLQIVAAILVATILASCGDKEETKKAAAKPAQVSCGTMAIHPCPLTGNVQLPGVIQPFEFVQIFPKISGFVKAVNVDRGSVVKKGQVLIILEAPEIEQQVAAAKQKYTQAQATYITSKDRYRRLLETSHTPGTISPYDLEAAASKMQGDSATAQGEYANFKAQETMKNYLIVTAPFDGIITERNVHSGALAGPGTQNAKPMLVLQQHSKLRLVVDIPEQFAMQVKNGDKVHYKTNALPGQDFTGTISRSSQSLSNNYRSETIEIDVANTDSRFKPGMYAEVILPTSGSANAYIVPRSAVVTTTERKYIIVADNNKARWVDISEGNQTNDSTEVFGRLSSGDKIVTNPTYHIKDGEVLNN